MKFSDNVLLMYLLDAALSLLMCCNTCASEHLLKLLLGTAHAFLLIWHACRPPFTMTSLQVKQGVVGLSRFYRKLSRSANVVL